jgi:hypothetical protein
MSGVGDHADTAIDAANGETCSLIADSASATLRLASTTPGVHGLILDACR